LSLIFIIGGVSTSTAATLFGSPVVASVVVVIAVVVVVSEASLPSLSQLTPILSVVWPPVWSRGPPLAIIIPLTQDNSKDKNQD